MSKRSMNIQLHGFHKLICMYVNETVTYKFNAYSSSMVAGSLLNLKWSNEKISAHIGLYNGHSILACIVNL